jgi:hypothetical protein
MRALTRPLLVLLAIIFLIEAWLWTRLEPVVGWVVARIPLRALKARIAGAIDRLSPPAALVVFIVPGIMLFPLKLMTIWLLAHKQLLLAGLVFSFAKLAGLGVTAFIFDATRPKLLQMAWFRWIYHRVLAGIAWAHGLVDPIKQRIRKALRIFAPGKAGRTVRLLWRIRSSMRTAATRARIDPSDAARKGR